MSGRWGDQRTAPAVGLDRVGQCIGDRIHQMDAAADRPVEPDDRVVVDTRRVGEVVVGAVEVDQRVLPAPAVTVSKLPFTS